MKKTFKTICYLFTAVLMCVNLTGCGNDGEGLWPFNNSNSAIVGTWEYTGSSFEYIEEWAEPHTMVFYSNGKMEYNFPTAPAYLKKMKGTYTFDPVTNKLILIPSEEFILIDEAEVVDYYVFFESENVISRVECYLVDEGQVDISKYKDFYKKIK